MYFEHIIDVLLCISLRYTQYMILQCTGMHPYFLLTLTSLHSFQILVSTHFSTAIKMGTSKFTYLLSITDASLHKSLGKLMGFYLT